MGDSGKGILGLLIGGALYAILKLGDEFIVIFDEILRVFDESLLLKLSIDEIGKEIAQFEFSIETMVLGLLAIFLILAIVDFVSSEI